MTEAEQLSLTLQAWAPLIASGYESPSAAQPMLDASKLIIDMADRLTRYEAALRKYGQEFCELGEYHDACGRMTDLDCSGCAARKALGDTQ